MAVEGGIEMGTLLLLLLLHLVLLLLLHTRLGSLSSGCDSLWRILGG